MRFLIEKLKLNFEAEQNRYILWLPVLFASGIGLFFLLQRDPSLWVVCSLLEVLILLIFLFRYHENALFLLKCLLIVCLGFTDIYLQSFYRLKHIQSPTDDKELTYLTGRIVAVEHNSQGKVRLLLDDAADFEHERQGLYRVTLRNNQTPFQTGDCVEMVATLMRPSLPVLPNTYQFDRKAFFEGIRAVGYASSLVYSAQCLRDLSWIERLKVFFENLRHKAVVRVEQNMEPDEAAIAAAVLAGERGAISPQLYQQYRDSGLAHFLSISGLHMGLMAAMAFFVLRLLIALIPPLALRFDSRKPAAVFAIFISLIYLFISGMAVPSQRAFMMTSLVLLGIIFNREAISMRTASFAAIVLLVVSPQVLISAGFQMSFAAVVVLIAFYERFATTLQRFFKRMGNVQKLAAYFIGLLLTDLVASLATLPFTIYHFNQISFYTLLGNLLAAPFIGFIVMPFILLSLILMPFGLDVWCLKIVGIGLWAVNQVTSYVSSLPGAGFRVAAMPLWGLLLIVLGGLWLCLWQRPWRRFGWLAIVAGVLSMLSVQKPIMLYDATGKVTAFADNNHQLVLMPTRGQKWLKNIWLEKMLISEPDDAMNKALKQIYQGKKINKELIDLSCGAKECVYRGLIRWRKNGKIEIEGKVRDTFADGGGAVYETPQGLRVQTVRESVGHRAWN